MSDFPLVIDILPVVTVDGESTKGEHDSDTTFALDLPLILIPAETEGDLPLKTIPVAALSAGLRGDEGVGYEGVRVYLAFFDDDVRRLYLAYILAVTN